MPDNETESEPNLLDELAGLDKPVTPPPAKPAVVAKPAPEEPDDEDEDDEEVAEGESPEPGNEKEEDGAEPEVEQKADDPDELPAKNLAALQRQAKRLREEHQRAMAQVEQARTAIQAERHALETERAKDAAERRELDLLKARAKSSPRAACLLLKRLGVTTDQFANVANHAFAMSDQADEKWKKEWGGDDGTVGLDQEELRRDVEEMKKWKQQQEEERQQREHATRSEAALSAYIDEVALKAKADKHPLMVAALKKNAAHAKHKLRLIAIHLARASGATPSQVVVMDQAERLIREEAEMYGLSQTTQKQDPDAAKQKPAKTKIATNGKPAKSPKTLEEELDELE